MPFRIVLDLSTNKSITLQRIRGVISRDVTGLTVYVIIVVTPPVDHREAPLSFSTLWRSHVLDLTLFKQPVDLKLCFFATVFFLQCLCLLFCSSLFSSLTLIFAAAPHDRSLDSVLCPLDLDIPPLHAVILGPAPQPFRQSQAVTECFRLFL